MFAHGGGTAEDAGGIDGELGLDVVDAIDAALEPGARLGAAAEAAERGFRGLTSPQELVRLDDGGVERGGGVDAGGVLMKEACTQGTRSETVRGPRRARCC